MKWILEKEVHDETDRHTEFRPLTQLESLTLSNPLKTVSGFLNAGIRGTIILGVFGYPVKKVRGFVISNAAQRELVAKIQDALFHRFSPSVPENLVDTKFEPVYEERLMEGQNSFVVVPDLFVIEIHVMRPPAPDAFFKLLDDGRHHFRQGGVNLPAKFEEMLSLREADEEGDMSRKMGIFSVQPESEVNAPLPKFGFKRLGRSKIHNAKIDSMRGYTQGTPCKFTSDSTHEIRDEDNVDAVSDAALANAINAFLNSGHGGTIYYGFAPSTENHRVRAPGKPTSGRVVPWVARGLLLPRDKRDQFRLGVDDVIDRFRPRPPHALFTVDYVPVLTWDKKTVSDLFLIEVSVAAQSSTIYFTADFRIYTRDGRRNTQIHVQDIRDMVIKERLSVWRQETRHMRETADAQTPLVNVTEDENRSTPVREENLIDVSVEDEEIATLETSLIDCPIVAATPINVVDVAKEKKGGNDSEIEEDSIRRKDEDGSISNLSTAEMMEELRRLTRENEVLKRKNASLTGELDERNNLDGAGEEGEGGVLFTSP